MSRGHRILLYSSDAPIRELPELQFTSNNQLKIVYLPSSRSDIFDSSGKCIGILGLYRFLPFLPYVFFGLKIIPVISYKCVIKRLPIYCTNMRVWFENGVFFLCLNCLSRLFKKRYIFLFFCK